ncbi:MAG: hypothetical protein CMB80_33215 [Flammeovirgaceae bacterium]|nr:hypothetical protein [Flammeovirgaceae bacterium]
MEQSTGMPLAEVRQLFNVRFADPTEGADRDISATQGALQRLSQEGYQGTKWDQAMANAGMALDEVMSPLRKWERGAHEI